jgi:sugar O-acyltransferase (sialic acid O-acetyltransferase NeuD family)
MGRQLASFITEESAFELYGFLDDSTVEPKPLQPLLGSVEEWSVSNGEVYLVALGDPRWRRHYVNLLRAKGARFATYISTRSIVGRDVQIGEGTMICPGAIVTTNVSLGQHVLLNIATSVSHDCLVGNYVTLSPGARATGGCILTDDVYMGVNSSLLPRVSLAMGITVGAGAVVTKSYEQENLTLVGIPAKPLDKSVAMVKVL